MPNWYYLEFGDEIGPVTPGELRELANLRRIDAETFVRRDDSADWIKATQVKGLLVLGADGIRDEPPRAIPIPASRSAVDHLSFNNAKGADATLFCTILIAIDALWFFFVAFFAPWEWLLFGLIGSIYFGLSCFAMGSLLRKNPAASMLVGMTFGGFGYAIVPFMPIVDDGSR